jgi:hypothetical protein
MKMPPDPGEWWVRATRTPQEGGTFKAKATQVLPRIQVTANGEGIVTHAGARLLAEVAEAVGLTAGVLQGHGAHRRAASTSGTRTQPFH